MQELPGPQIGINSTAPTAVALFGIARGYKTYTESIVINADSVGVTTVFTVVVTGTGTWGLTWLSGDQATGLSVTANATTVETALEDLGAVGDNNVEVSSPSTGTYVITCIGALAGTSQPVPTKIVSGLSGGDVVISKHDVGTPAINRTLGQQGIKVPVVVADATTNVNIQSPGASIAGVTLTAGQVVQLDGQTASSENGVYTWVGPTTPLTPITFVVRNPNTGAPFTLNHDYTIYRVSAGPDGIPGSRDDTYTILRVIDDGGIAEGDTVQITYQYTDTAYFTPTLFYDYDDVRDMYGEPFDANGNIVSELTLGAKFAFLNKAFQVVCVAVDPVNPSSPTVGDYSNALDLLADNPYVSVVVACTGSQPLFALISDHVSQQSDNRFERRAIVGRDGSVNAVASSQRIIDAQSLTFERMLMVCPTAFYYFSPELNRQVTLGAQFMAASLAGLTTFLNPSMPLTRKVLAGFTDVVESEQEGQKNLETQNGLCVIEKTRRQLIQVRHGVTTDPTSLLTREWSIRGQSDAMVYRIRDYLESDDLIGQPITQITMINCKASAEAALQSLIRDSIIVSYTGLKCRQLLQNPDVLQISYSWLPAFPLNYILVTYAVSLTTGDVTTNAGDVSTTDVTQNTTDDGNTLTSV